MSANDKVPCFTVLKEFLETVYENPGPDVFQRFAELVASYRKQHGSPPEYIARSPGRVNLIGEHIDYEGYSVLPMAIRQDTVIAIGKAGTSTVHVSNVHPDHSSNSFGVDPQLEVNVNNHSWTNYVHAAYKGVFEALTAHHPDLHPQPVGLNLVVEGQVPQGSGLSSSAALVCSAALAVLGTLGVTLQQGEVAAFTAACEKYVGTESGGMDQAISIMGQKGLAKLVHFKPTISTEDVPLPPGATFVIANSLTRSAKAETAAKNYNMRVVECRLAAAALGVALEPHAREEALSRTTLREVEHLLRPKQDAMAGPKGSVTGAEEAVVREALPEAVYSEEAVEKLLGVSLEEMFAGNPSQLRCLAVARESGGFKLQQRALHVYAERARVPEFKRVCEGAAPPAEKCAQLGELMDASQASCRDLYECSCAELDRLVAVAKGAGALGARLTGAGWGGCTVSLVREADVGAFIEKVKSEYYQDGVREGLLPADLFEDVAKSGGVRPKAGWDAVIFASRPGSGGAVLQLSPDNAAKLL